MKNNLEKIKKEKDTELMSAALNKMAEKIADVHLVRKESEGFIELRYASITIMMDERGLHELALFINHKLVTKLVNYELKNLFMEVYNATMARDKEVASKKAEEAFNNEVEKINKYFEDNMRELNVIFS